MICFSGKWHLQRRTGRTSALPWQIAHSPKTLESWCSGYQQPIEREMFQFPFLKGLSDGKVNQRVDGVSD